jgi:hypothetical protein
MTATEVFLDQLKDGGGDLVNISSVAGRTAGPATPVRGDQAGHERLVRSAAPGALARRARDRRPARRRGDRAARAHHPTARPSSSSSRATPSCRRSGGHRRNHRFRRHPAAGRVAQRDPRPADGAGAFTEMTKDAVRRRALALVVEGVTLLATACGSSGATAHRAAASGASSRSVAVDGTTRDYRLYRPPGLTRRAPLVLVYHDWQQNVQWSQRLAWQQAADRHGFVVAFPVGAMSRSTPAGAAGPPRSKASTTSRRRTRSSTTSPGGFGWTVDGSTPPVFRRRDDGLPAGLRIGPLRRRRTRRRVAGRREQRVSMRPRKETSRRTEKP